MKEQTLRYFKNIRFWIFLFFVVRLYGIWFPPLEVSHNWRQTTVTMVARNFYEDGADLLHPKIDIAGEMSGVTGMEFPVLNYLIYLLSCVFGYEHWYGRLINLLITSIGLLFFHKLVEKYFKKEIAFNATIILLFSIWYTYSRKIMPDTFSMSFTIAALYYCTNYLENKKPTQLLLAFVCTAIGTLAKLPAAYILILLLIPYFNSAISLQRKVVLAICLIGSIVFPAWYYFKWVPYLETTYGFHHFFMGKSMTQGALELWQHLPETLSRFYDTALKFVGFACFVFGVYKSIKLKNTLLLAVVSIGFVGFLPIMLKGGFTFYHHSYYIIPFVPIMALMSAYGVEQIPNKKFATIVLIAIGVEGFFNHIDDFRIKPENQAITKLENVMDSISQPKDLVAINSGAFPTPMYFAHRRGWVAFNGQLLTPKFTDSISQLGLRHIIILKRTFGDNMTPPDSAITWKKRYSSEDFDVYSNNLFFEK